MPSELQPGAALSNDESPNAGGRTSGGHDYDVASGSASGSRSGSVVGRPRLLKFGSVTSVGSVQGRPVGWTEPTQHLAEAEYARRISKRVKRLEGKTGHGHGRGHGKTMSLPALPVWLGGGGGRGGHRRSGSTRSGHKQHQHSGSLASTMTRRSIEQGESSEEEPDLRRRFRGHRSKSFTTEFDPELTTEIRARQRTFEGAYWRTALGALSYALVVLKIFTRRFYNIGLILVILSGLLIVVAIIRRRRSDSDFADDFWQVREEDDVSRRTHIGVEDPRAAEGLVAGSSSSPAPAPTSDPAHDDDSRPPLTSPSVRTSQESLRKHQAPRQRLSTSADSLRLARDPGEVQPIVTKGQTGRLWGRHFRTSGLVVVLTAIVVGSAEILLIVFINLLPNEQI